MARLRTAFHRKRPLTYRIFLPGISVNECSLSRPVNLITAFSCSLQGKTIDYSITATNETVQRPIRL